MEKRSRKGLVVPLIFALVGVAILLTLGTWQMQRRQWKLNLIEQIETRSKLPPISIAEAVSHWNADNDIEFIHMTAEGRFEHDKERHLFTVEDGVAGWRIITPMKLARGGEIFIDRGFVPDHLKDKALRREGLIWGLTRVTGLLRKSEEKGFFTLDNRFESNEFFWRSLTDMAKSAYGAIPQNLAPFFLVAQKSETAGPEWPRPRATPPDLPNRHLEYALTWYSLALVLIVIFGLFARKRMRED